MTASTSVAAGHRAGCRRCGHHRGGWLAHGGCGQGPGCRCAHHHRWLAHGGTGARDYGCPGRPLLGVGRRADRPRRASEARTARPTCRAGRRGRRRSGPPGAVAAGARRPLRCRRRGRGRGRGLGRRICDGQRLTHRESMVVVIDGHQRREHHHPCDAGSADGLAGTVGRVGPAAAGSIHPAMVRCPKQEQGETCSRKRRRLVEDLGTCQVRRPRAWPAAGRVCRWRR